MSSRPPLDANVRPDAYQPPQNVEELLVRYAQGERFFVAVELPDGAQLCGICLEGANFEEGWLSDADLRGANLRTVNFANANLKCADFQGADLAGASFQGAAIESANFRDSNWLSATFAGATAYGYTLKEEDKIRLVPSAPNATPLPLLSVVQGENKDLVYQIVPGKNVVGRRADRPVQINLADQEPTGRVWSSSQHCLINFAGNELLIEDLNSANGTYVNRMRLAPGEKRPLASGDVIQVGTVQLRLHVPFTVANGASGPTAPPGSQDAAALSKTV